MARRKPSLIQAENPFNAAERCELRILFNHRPHGAYIGLPWSKWCSLKLEVEKAAETKHCVLRSVPDRESKYPDAVFVRATGDEQQARSATQVEDLRGWYFYPVIKG